MSQRLTLRFRAGLPFPRNLDNAHSSETGITVLIPTYTAPDSDRTASFRVCIESLAMGLPPDLRVAVLVVDNGLSADGAHAVKQVLGESGLPYHVMTAPRGTDRRHQTAAHARNIGLTALAALPAARPLRHRYLLFLDDDNAVGPGAVTELIGALDELPRAIAVCPKIEVVPDLESWRPSVLPAMPVEPRRLPGPLYQGRYDLLSVTSHGSCLAGRVVGLMVRQEPLMEWIRRAEHLFFEETPFGSSEDMLAMADLSQFGEIWSIPTARVADQARESPASTRTQQFGWGYDHAWLARALAEASLLESGVHVLSWDEVAGWTQTRVAVPGITGFLVNPGELRVVGSVVRTLAKERRIGAALFHQQNDVVASGADKLMRILDWWEQGPVIAQRVARPDLPPLTQRDWGSLRDGLEGIVGHIAGNIAGTHDIDPEPLGLPRFFLFGARQPADKPVTCRPE